MDSEHPGKGSDRSKCEKRKQNGIRYALLPVRVKGSSEFDLGPDHLGRQWKIIRFYGILTFS